MKPESSDWQVLKAGSHVGLDAETLSAIMRAAADEIEQLRRKNEHLISCINGISRQCSEMAKANQ